MARIPEPDEHRRRWAELGVDERRAVLRAVNRGVAVERRPHAALAVGVARRQQRFWRLAWLVGPVVGLVEGLRLGWEGAVINGGLITVFLIGFSWFWIRRARRAEAANLARAGARGGS